MSSVYSSCKALVIGVGRYADPQYDLSYARPDAEALAELLANEFGFDQVWTLYDSDATRQRLIHFFEQDLQRTEEDDGLLIFFAGHGITVTSGIGDDRGFLVPHDGDPKQPYANLSLTTIRDDYMPMIPAKHVLLIVDACYGGLALRDVTTVERPKTIDDAVLAELTRRDRKVRQVLAAGTKDQRVLDGGLFGHSVFTGRLIEAMREANPYITADHVGAHVRERVARDSLDRKHHQTPQFGYLTGGDGTFVLCRVGKQTTPPRIRADHRASSRGPSPASDQSREAATHAPDDSSCPSCGSPVHSSWKACPQCGMKLRMHCPACGMRLQPSWRACPSCGEPMKGGSGDSSEQQIAGNRVHANAGGNQPRGKSSAGAPDKSGTTFRVPSVKQLVDFAYSNDGLNLNTEDAAQWADDKIAFFKDHDFAKWRELFDWAYSDDGLNLGSEEAEQWANDKIAFFEDHEFAKWRELFDWAYSSDGLNLGSEEAEQWANDKIACFEDHEFAKWRDLFDWAYSDDGLNLGSEEAEQWANDKIAFFEDHEFAKWRELFDWAYSSDGLNLGSEEAEQWANDKIACFEDHEFAKWRELFDWAYSDDGLNLGSEEAEQWANDKIAFFEDHEFAKWRELFDWAYSSDGLNLGSEEAEQWADTEILKKARKRAR